MPRLAPVALKSVHICWVPPSQSAWIWPLKPFLKGSWAVYRAPKLRSLYGSPEVQIGWSVDMIQISFFISPNLLTKEKWSHKLIWGQKELEPLVSIIQFSVLSYSNTHHMSNALHGPTEEWHHIPDDRRFQAPDLSACKQSFSGTAELPYFRAPRQEAWCGPHRI